MAAVAANPLLQESIWFDRRKFEEAETLYHERLYQQKYGGSSEEVKLIEPPSSPAKAAAAHTGGAAPTGGTAPKGGHGQDATLAKRLDNLENENKDLRKVTEDLRSMMTKMEARISAMDKGGASGQTTGKPPAAAKKESSSEEEEEEDMDLFGSDPPAAAKKESSSAEDTEEDMDLFGSDDEEEEAERERIKQERIAAYQEKKTKKPAIVAKSNVIFDVKPWDDTTDMKKVEELVRTIEMEGLRWGAGKLVDLAYGIKKLQICCIVEDEKVSTEDVEDLIRGFEDYVQSTDIAAFQKI